MNVVVILPVKNEQETILKVIKELKSILALHQLNIVVVSDSSDNTDKIVRNITNVSLVQGEDKGLGAAVKKGLGHIKNFQYEIAFILDSDEQTEYRETLLFIEEYQKSRPDLLIASRFKRSGLISYSYHYSNRLGVYLLTKYLRFMTGLDITDSHGGIRLLTKELVDNLKIYGNHTYVQEMIIDAHFKNFKIVELSSKWKPRLHGESRVVRSKFRYIRRTLPYLIYRLIKHKVFRT